MKTTIQPYLLLVCLCLLSNSLFAQWFTKDATEFQNQLNEWYAGEENSPFKDDATRENFKELNFFTINDDYKVIAEFTKAKKKRTKQYATSSGQKHPYSEIGTVEFTLKGESVKLAVLKGEFGEDDKFNDYLTIPFIDLTSGETTYGGGRYLGIWLQDIKYGKVELNFNLAYQPYCAYLKGYSCLIPPRKNFIPVKVEAGVKNDIVWKN